MKNLTEVQTFLTELGIGHNWNGAELELNEADVNGIGGRDEVYAAVKATFGKGFAMGTCSSNGVYFLTSIY